MIFHVQRQAGDFDGQFDTTEVVRAGHLWNYIKHFQENGWRKKERTRPFLMIERPFHWNGVTEEIVGDPDKLFTEVGQKLEIGLLCSSHSTDIEQWLLTITAHEDGDLEQGLDKARAKLAEHGWTSLKIEM